MESAENQEQPISDQGSQTNTSPALSKTETIALLNDSIDRLEETIKRISEDSVQIPPSDSINTLLTTTQELEDAVTSIEAKIFNPEATKQQTKPQVEQLKTRTKVKTETSSSPQKVVKKTKKNNFGLITIGVTAIAIAIVAIFWLWKPPALVNLLPQAQSTPIETVAETDFSVNQPSETPVIDISDFPDSLDNVADFPDVIKPVAKPIEDVVETIIPPELTSPGKAKNLKIVTIKPQLNFSPEQNLIAVLETKVKELAQDYPQELIENIQVNLPENSLLVRVKDDWYQLDESAQNIVGNDIFQRSRAFSFDKLEFKDNLGTLVARNPIVGDQIIVLRNVQKQLDPEQN